MYVRPSNAFFYELSTFCVLRLFKFSITVTMTLISSYKLQFLLLFWEILPLLNVIVLVLTEYFQFAAAFIKRRSNQH